MAETPRDERYEVYLNEIRRRVCAVCLDQRDDGTCGITTDRVCGIEAHLPDVVEAILPIKSNRMDDYVNAILAQVCSRSSVEQ